MSNPDHVEIVKQGAEAIQKWRQEKPDVRRGNLEILNLIDADLNRANLSGMDLSHADLSGAILSRADLSEANLWHADLGRADLNEATLYRAYLGGADLHLAILCKADLHGANLRTANLCDADLRGANLRGADLGYAYLGGADLDAARGLEHVYDLETVRLISPEDEDKGLKPIKDADSFETCRRPWPERWLDWERLRVVGRLPLFGISYTTLILIPVVFYGLALYNRNIDLVHAWAQEAITSPDHPLHRLAPPILERLHHLPIPRLSFVLFVSTILLAVGSTLYQLGCPSRIKEFSRDQWCDQLGRSLLHYWALAWKYRYIHLICAACYALGGFGAAWVLGWKLWETGQFIWTYSTWPWPWR